MRHLLFFLLLLLTANILKASKIDTAGAEKHFTKKQLEDDVKFLTATIADVHPHMYHSINQKQYQRLTDSVINELADGMTGKQAWPLISRLVGALGEGHSSFNLPGNFATDLKKGGNVLFPVSIREFNGKYFVVKADGSGEDALMPGDNISSINGIGAAQLIDDLSRHMGGLKLWRANDVCRNIIPYLDIYNIHGPYHISFLRGGRSDSVTLKPVSFADYVSYIRAKAGKSTAIPLTRDLSFSYLESGKAYLSINSLTAKPEIFKYFLDSVFTQLKQTPSATLIIDLRRNGGGNSALGETLLNYITDKPFRMQGGVKWKVSQEYKNQLSKGMNAEAVESMAYYMNAENGSVLESGDSKPQKHAASQLLFKGKVVVLIGPRTFSSANMLANTIQDYNLATLVGEPSGEPANDYGELITVVLPNTGFSFTTSTKQFIRANGNSTDGQPVLPKYSVYDDPLTPVDEVLEFAKKM